MVSYSVHVPYLPVFTIGLWQWLIEWIGIWSLIIRTLLLILTFPLALFYLRGKTSLRKMLQNDGARIPLQPRLISWTANRVVLINLGSILLLLLAIYTLM